MVSPWLKLFVYYPEARALFGNIPYKATVLTDTHFTATQPKPKQSHEVRMSGVR